jgi:hypothetical protein
MPKTITASVGRAGGVNRPADVKVVQELLNKISIMAGGAERSLAADSLCGPRTVEAIQKFQVKQFGWARADGRVDPKGPTLQRLNDLAGCADPGSPKMLSIHSKLLCQHGGSVSIVPVGPRGTTPSGQPAARPSDRFVISGCANPRATCVRVQWLIASDPLNNSNVGMCFTASGVPAGQLIIINADHYSPVRAGGF